MPLFNFRQAGSSSAPKAASAVQTESVEAIRKRAKHRLIGSGVLVLIGVVGFPLLFDTQPRPIAMDIPIEIPGKNTVKPLVLPDAANGTPAKPHSAASSAAGSSAASSGVAPAVAAEKVAAASSLGEREELLVDKKAGVVAKPQVLAIKSEVKPVPKPEAKPEARAEPKAIAKPALPVDDGRRAKALLDGKVEVAAAVSAAPKPAAAIPPAPAPVAAEGRMIVQVGAFADVTKAREARIKLEKAGLKTYTQVAETADGKRIRVRVGPFTTRAEAEKAVSKIKGLDLSASILTL
jgi:DedD protein